MCPEDESVILSSISTTIGQVSVRQGKCITTHTFYMSYFSVVLDPGLVDILNLYEVNRGILDHTNENTFNAWLVSQNLSVELEVVIVLPFLERFIKTFLVWDNWMLQSMHF